MSSWFDVRILPAPSSTHSTCAWCGFEAESIVQLIDHVDELHVEDAEVA